MEWIRSPLFLIAVGFYALVMFFLLSTFLKGGERKKPRVSNPPREGFRSSVEEGEAYVLPVAESEARQFSHEERRPPVSSRGESDWHRTEFCKEAEQLFSGEKEPVFVTDEQFQVFYRNRAARKLFGGPLDTEEEPLFAVLGAEERVLSKILSKSDPGKVLTVSCRLPSGSEGTAQVHFAIMNRVPRVNAFRVTGLEESKPSWLSRGEKGGDSTSLTKGGHLDFREVDPASVELSADQMLGPLREIDDLLQKVSTSREDGTTGEGNQPLQSARSKLRRTIRHIEEIDWMLQVTDGHLHLRTDTFRGYEVLSSLAEAANRLAGPETGRLKLQPTEAPAVEPLLSGDRRIFEKILTQLLTSAFRAADKGGVAAEYGFEPLETPSQSDDWYLFAGEEQTRSQATMITVRISFRRPSEEASGSDLPAVVETLGSRILDPRMNRRLDFVRKGRDSDLFGLTLARELVGKLEGELSFLSGEEGKSEFQLRLRFENVSL